MKKNIFVSFVLTAVFVFGAFFAATPAGAQASTLWGAAQEQLGANASNSAVASLAKQMAVRFGISVPEWGIPGSRDARKLNQTFLKTIFGRSASAEAGGITVGQLSPTVTDAGIATNYTFSANGPLLGATQCTVAWGDDTSTDTTAFLYGTPTSVATNHTYSSNGVYTATINCVNQFSFDVIYTGSSVTSIQVGDSGPVASLVITNSSPVFCTTDTSSQPASVLLAIDTPTCHVGTVTNNYVTVDGTVTVSGAGNYFKSLTVNVKKPNDPTPQPHAYTNDISFLQLTSYPISNMNLSVFFTGGAGIYEIHEIAESTNGQIVTLVKTVNYEPLPPAPKSITFQNNVLDANGNVLVGSCGTDSPATAILAVATNPTIVCNYVSPTPGININGLVVPTQTIVQHAQIDSQAPGGSLVREWTYDYVPLPTAVILGVASGVSYNFNYTLPVGSTHFFEYATSTDGQVANVEKIVTYQPDTGDIIAPTIENRITINGQDIVPNCELAPTDVWTRRTGGSASVGLAVLPSSSTVCNYGTITTNNVVWSAVINDNSGMINSFIARITPPGSPAVIISATATAVPTSYYTDALLTSFLTVPGTYTIVEEAIDRAGNLTSFTKILNYQPASTVSISIENQVFEQPSGTELIGTCTPVLNPGDVWAASASLAVATVSANENCNYPSTSSSSVNIIATPAVTNTVVTGFNAVLISTPTGPTNTLLCTYSPIFDTAIMAFGGDTCVYPFSFENGAGTYTIRETVTTSTGLLYSVDKILNYLPVVSDQPGSIVNNLSISGIAKTPICGDVLNPTDVWSASALLAIAQTGPVTTCDYGTNVLNGVPLQINGNATDLDGIASFNVTVFDPNNVSVEKLNYIALEPAPLFDFNVFHFLPIGSPVGTYRIVETMTDVNGNVTTFIKLVNHQPDTVFPSINNRISVNGLNVPAVSCTTPPGIPGGPVPPTTCDYGTLTGPVSVTMTALDNGPVLSAVSMNMQQTAPVFAPLPFSFNQSNVPVPFTHTVDITSFLVSGNSYRLIENARDASNNTISFIKTFKYLPAPLDNDDPTILNNNYTGPATVFNANYLVSGTVTDPSTQAQTVTIHKEGGDAWCGDTSPFDQVLNNVTNFTINFTSRSNLVGSALMAVTPINCETISWSSNAGANTLNYNNPMTFTFTQGVTQVGPQIFAVPVFKIRISFNGTDVVAQAFDVNGVEVLSYPVYCGTTSAPANASLAFTVAPCLALPMTFPAASGTGIDYVIATINGNPVPSTNLLLSDAFNGIFSFPVVLTPGLNTIVETVCDKAVPANCVDFTKTVTYINDTIAPTVDNTLSINGQVAVPVCNTLPGIPGGPVSPTTCDYGTISSSNIDWSAVFNDDSGNLTFLQADLLPPIPALPINLASSLLTLAPYSVSENLAPYITVPGSYRLVENARDAAGNIVSIIKTWNYVPDVTPPAIRNNPYNREAMINPSITLSGSVSDAQPSLGIQNSVNVTVLNSTGTQNIVVPISFTDLTNGTFSFNVNLVSGLNTIVETICDNVGLCTSFTKEITFYPSRGYVSVEQVESGNKQTDAALLTKVFSNIAGSCAATLGDMPKNWDVIFNTCVAENTKNETNSPVVGKGPRNFISDLVGIGMGTGDKLVIVRSQQNNDGSYGYVGFKLPGMVAGETRNVGFERNPGQDAKGVFVQTSNFTKNSKGIWQGSHRAEVIQKGIFSLGAQAIDATTEGALQVFTPEHITWANGTEIYPFLFISEGEWTLDVCLSVPSGYSIVAPGTCDQAFIANEARVVEFTLSEGSAAAAALLSQSVGEPTFGVSLSAKAAGTTVAQTSSYKVEGTRHSAKRASDRALAPKIAKITADQVAAEKAEADKVATVIAIAEQAGKGQTVSAIAKTFKLNLTAGTQGEDVKTLQQYLNNKGFTVSTTGPGSKGAESTYFGVKTKEALKKFQEAYAKDILVPAGLKNGTGYFGEKTRAFINANQ